MHAVTPQSNNPQQPNYPKAHEHITHAALTGAPSDPDRAKDSPADWPVRDVDNPTKGDLHELPMIAVSGQPSWATSTYCHMHERAGRTPIRATSTDPT